MQIKTLCHALKYRGKGLTKIVLVMKLTSILILMVALQVSSKGRAQTVTYTAEAVPLPQVLSIVEKQTSYNIFYDLNDLQGSTPVTVRLKATPLRNALETILAGQPLMFDIQGNTIFIVKKSPQVLPAQSDTSHRSVKINGMVINEKGEPLVGASVRIKNAAKGTVTDVKGNFTIAGTEEDKVLIVSNVGYNSVEMNISPQKFLTIRLTPFMVKLEDMVIIGYGSQKKANITGSVAVVKLDDVKRVVPTVSVGNLLQGQVAGLRVNTPSGVPGAMPTFNIRQVTTFDKDDKKPFQAVLFVIDGMVTDNPADFNNLSPNDIDNMSVLRDAAAAAAYGARAAGGVIVVTTRRGTKSARPVINYSFNTGVDKRTRNAPLTSAVEAGLLYNRINPNASDLWTNEELDYFKTVNNGWGYDQLAAVWRNPSTSSHNLSVSGGGDKVRYYMGGSMITQNSFVENLDYKKYNLRSNVTADITDRLQLFAGLALNTSTRNSPPTGDDFNDWYGKLRVWQPEQPVWTNGGHPIDYGWIMNMGAQVRGDGGYKKNTSVNPTINLKLSYKIPGIDGLTASAQYSRNWSNTRYRNFEKKYDVWVMKRPSNRIISLDEKDLVGLKKTNQVSNDYLEEDYRWSDYSQLNLQLSYDHTFGKSHHVGGWVLMEKGQTEVGGADAYRQNFPIYTTDQWWAASKDPNDLSVDGITNERNGRKSWVGQFFYDYEGKYLATFSYRYDGSYKFPVDSRWGFFPSASAGWVISKEKFFQHVKGIDLLKLRGSVGLTSADNIAAYQWMQIYNTGKNAYFGTSPITSTGIQYGNITNPIVTWEKTKSYNVAIDVEFLRHFNATAEYYFINTYDILAKRIQTISPTFPREMPAENYGEVHAQGMELTVGYNNHVGNLKYYANANASYGGATYVIKDQNVTYPYQDEIGHSTTRIVTRVADHILRTQADLDALLAANPNYKYYGIAPQKGQMVYKDISGPNGKPDGIIDDYDKVELKRNNNPVLLALNFGFEWKGFSVDATLNGTVRNYKFVNDLAGNVEWNRNWKEWYSNSWTPENPNAGLPIRYSSNDGNNRVTSDESSFWLKRNDFLRLRLLNIGYTLPAKMISRWGVSGLKVYFSGSNLFVISKFNSKYYDPEMGSHANYPVMKNFNFGVNVTL